MERRRIIIFILALALVSIYFYNKKVKNITVASVEDGNTIELSNGARVRLIGISSSRQGQEYLNDNVVGKEVILVSDETAPFNVKKIKEGDLVFAYVLSNDKMIDYNAQTLKLGLSDIQESVYLQDSLSIFRKYAAIGLKIRNEEGVEPTPTPVPIIDYEDDEIVLPDPPSPDDKRKRRHQAWYDNGDMNVEMVDEACDYDCPYTKKFANDLAGRSPGNFNAGQICEVFKYCYNKWRYVNDPNGHEYVAMASESISCNLAGDCDDFAVLMSSCMLAIGGNACVNTGFGSEGGHAFAEVDIASIGERIMLQVVKDKFPNNSISSLQVRHDGNHIWLNLDWWAAYPGGKYFNCSRRDAYSCINGIWTWKKIK